MKEIKRMTTIDNEEFLRQVSAEVVFPDAELENIIGDLKNFCENNNVWAMAAVQIGIPKRIIYIKSTNENLKADDEAKIYINPKILKSRGKTKFWEACASGIAENGELFTALIERPYEIQIEYQDENGNKKEQTLKGFETTVFAHEFDHLQGVFHTDNAKGEIKILGFEERKTMREKEPYNIISK